MRRRSKKKVHRIVQCNSITHVFPISVVDTRAVKHFSHVFPTKPIAFTVTLLHMYFRYRSSIPGMYIVVTVVLITVFTQVLPVKLSYHVFPDKADCVQCNSITHIFTISVVDTRAVKHFPHVFPTKPIAFTVTLLHMYFQYRLSKPGPSSVFPKYSRQSRLRSP